MKALVLGAREGSGNIGEAIVEELRLRHFDAWGDDCAWLIAGTKYDSPDHTRPVYMAPKHADLVDIDVLVISLGATIIKPWTELREDELEDVLRGSLELPLRAALRYVQARETTDPTGGRIIFIGSYAHRHPFTNGTTYCAAKAGLHMAAQTLAWEVTDLGYRVHIVHPYHVEGTPMWERVQAGVMETKGMSRAEADAYARKDLKMPEPLSVREVAQTVAWLAAPGASDWLSGTALELNGGTR